MIDSKVEVPLAVWLKKGKIQIPSLFHLKSTDVWKCQVSLEDGVDGWW